jgi:hypothetical protein
MKAKRNLSSERLLASRPRRKIAGLGKFRSLIHDLGSNKAHLKNFGR